MSGAGEGFARFMPKSNEARARSELWIGIADDQPACGNSYTKKTPRKLPYVTCQGQHQQPLEASPATGDMVNWARYALVCFDCS